MKVLLVQDNQTVPSQPGLPAMTPQPHMNQDTAGTAPYNHDQGNYYGYSQDIAANIQDYGDPYQMDYPADDQGYYYQDQMAAQGGIL